MTKAKTDKASETKTPAAAKAPPAKAKGPKLETGYEVPTKLYIVGLDDGFREGEPGWDPELQDPDRLSAPDQGYVDNMIEHGHDKPVGVVYKDHSAFGKVRVVFDGRQHVMGARIANDRIGQSAVDPILVAYYVKTAGATALDVARANEWARKDSPLVKAKRAIRLAGLGYKEAEIIKCFSDDGARPITKMTLINWKRAANCCAVIQDGFSAGEYPITILYEIGKIKGEGPDAESKEIDKATKQIAALEAIKADNGTLKGKAGRENASTAAEESGEEGGEDSGGSRAKSAKMSAEGIKDLAKIFEADEEEPFTDMIRGADGKTLVASRTYQDGDFQGLASALLAAIVGDDPGGEALQAFPSVFRHVKKYLRTK